MNLLHMDHIRAESYLNKNVLNNTISDVLNKKYSTTHYNRIKLKQGTQEYSVVEQEPYKMVSRNIKGIQ